MPHGFNEEKCFGSFFPRYKFIEANDMCVTNLDPRGMAGRPGVIVISNCNYL